MGLPLTNNTIQSTYDGLLKTFNNGILTATPTFICDGFGNDSTLKLSTDVIDMTAASAISGSTFSGSFVGDGSGLTGIVATAVEDLNGLTGEVDLVAGDNITINIDGQNIEISSSAGGGGTPGGSDTQIQFNDNGAFGGDANFTFDDTTNTFTLTGGFTHTGNYTLDGNISLTNDHNISFNGLGGSNKPEGISWPNFSTWGEELDHNATGETIAVGTAITPNAGELYIWRSGGGWTSANNGSQNTAAGTLGWSVHSASTNRFIAKGMISVKNTEMLGTSPGIGDVVYLGGTDGHFTVDAPGSGTIKRKLGQIMDTFVSGRTTYYKIWFDPDWYYET